MVNKGKENKGKKTIGQEMKGWLITYSLPTPLDPPLQYIYHT